MKRVKLIILAASIIFTCPHIAPAQEEEWSSFEAACCTIQFLDKEHLKEFTLRIGGFKYTSKGLDDNPLNVKARLDEIMQKVQDTLDMHPSGIHIAVLLYPDRTGLETVFKQFAVSGNIPIAFYAHKTRSIYVNIDSVTDGVLAHEMAHAIINAYFRVPPPAKMQEILAQYVDLHLWD